LTGVRLRVDLGALHHGDEPAKTWLDSSFYDNTATETRLDDIALNIVKSTRLLFLLIVGLGVGGIALATQTLFVERAESEPGIT
jgi:hypothetical protein